MIYSNIIVLFKLDTIIQLINPLQVILLSKEKTVFFFITLFYNDYFHEKYRSRQVFIKLKHTMLVIAYDIFNC